MFFCVDKIEVSDKFRSNHGVLTMSGMKITADATLAAQHIVNEAHEQAAEVLSQAKKDAEDIAIQVERQTLEKAKNILDALQSTHDTFLDRGQGIIVDLAQALFDRLVMDMTPREKIAATLQRLLQEAPSKLVNPVLRVHPDDIEFITDVEWELKKDNSLVRGTCKLEAHSGEWCVDFEAAVAALKLGLKLNTE